MPSWLNHQFGKIKYNMKLNFNTKRPKKKKKKWCHKISIFAYNIPCSFCQEDLKLYQLRFLYYQKTKLKPDQRKMCLFGTILSNHFFGMDEEKVCLFLRYLRNFCRLLFLTYIKSINASHVINKLGINWDEVVELSLVII